MLGYLGSLLFPVLPASATEPHHDLKLELDTPNNLWRLTWPSVTGRTYFIQHSNDLLAPWSWIPAVEPGNGQMKEWAFQNTPDKAFWRLVSSDIATNDPEGADFDGDKISNLAELQQGTHPLENPDLDTDGLPDDWEVAYGLNPSDGQDAQMDTDGDGLNNLQEWQDGTRPDFGDSDGDGYQDGEEFAGQSSAIQAREIPDKPAYVVLKIKSIPDYEYESDLIIKKLTDSGFVLFECWEVDSPHYFPYEHYTFYRWQASTQAIHRLDEPAGYPLPVGETEVYANDINEEGIVVGEYYDLREEARTAQIEAMIEPWQPNPNNPEHEGRQEVKHTYESRPSARPLYWPLGTGTASVLNMPSFNTTFTFAIYDIHPDFSAVDPIFDTDNLPLSLGIAKAIDDTGKIYGIGLLGYTEIPHGQYPPAEKRMGFDDLVQWSSTSGAMAQLGSKDPSSYNTKIGVHINMARGPHHAGWREMTSSPLWMPQINLTDVNMFYYDLDSQGRMLGEIRTATGARTGTIKVYDIATAQYLDLPEEMNEVPYAISGGGEYLAGGGTSLWYRNPRTEGVAQVNLADSLPADSPWEVLHAQKINQRGMIAATAYNHDENLHYAVALVRMDLKSKDRVLRGSIDIPEGWTQFGLSFKNKDTDQDLGTFTNLEPGATTDVKIYDSPDDFFSDEEMEQNQSGSLPDNAKNQKVTFARDPENPRKLQFCAVFDDVGEIEVKLKFGSTQTEGIAGHTLTADAAMADFINTMNERVASIEVPGSEELLIDIDGDGFPNSLNPNDILHGHQPGTVSIPGAIVHEDLEDDPLNLVLPINSDDDDGNGQPDNADASITSGDNDITRLVLKRPALATGNGTLTLTVSHASAVRVFNSNGSTVLSSYTVDLASPSGDLAALANGSVPIYVEGLSESADVTFTLTYRNTNNEVVATDSVHLTVADPSSLALLRMVHGFQSVAGNSRQVQWRTYADNGAMTTARLDLAPIGENPPLQNRGMLSKVLWTTVDGYSKIQLAFVKGFVDGFWIALKGEVETVEGIWTFFRDNPYGRCAAIGATVQEAIEDLKEIPPDQLPGMLASIPRVLAESLYTSAEQQIPWQPLSSGISPDVIAYMNGFVTGTITEGVAISLLGVGVATKTATVIKGIFAGAKAGQYALTMLNNLRKATSKMTDLLMKLAKSKKGSIHIGAVAKRLEKIELPSGKTVPEAFTEGLNDKPELTEKVMESYHYHDQAIADEARAATRIQTSVHSFAKLQDIMGNTLTDLGKESFAKLQQRMFVKGVDNADCLPELKQMFDLDSTAGKADFNKFLEDAKSILDDPQSAIKASDIDNPNWPLNNGFMPSDPNPRSFSQGTIFTRYQRTNQPLGGRSVSLGDDPFWARSLPGEESDYFKRTFRVISPQTEPFDSGRAAPWFNQPGGTQQVTFNRSVEQLIADGILEEITQ